MFQATRLRLALWYTGITAVVLLLLATGVYLYVRSTLIERVDDTLSHVVEVIERSLVIEPTDAQNQPYQVNVLASFPNNSQDVDDDHIDLEWFDAYGRPTWTTLAEPLPNPLHPNRHETICIRRADQDYTLRQVTAVIKRDRYLLGYLRVSHPWFEVTKPSRDLAIDLAFGITSILTSVGAIGWFLSGLAIKPVRDSYQSLRQFTSDASHELRNPIAVIQSNVQIALADPELDPDHPQQRQLIDSLRLVERLNKRLGRLVDDLLFLTRTDSGIVPLTKQSVPLDALLVQVITEQQSLAQQKQINLNLSFPDTTAPEQEMTVIGDWEQLARLFTNLISNAINYTPEYGKVEVSIHAKGACLQVQVQDTGFGISEEDLPHVFDRFYRSESARSHASGSGLGLAIAKAIVSNHQGEITVASKKCYGTTFSVALPRPK